MKHENTVAEHRELIRRNRLCAEDELIRRLAQDSGLDAVTRAQISTRTAALVESLRAAGKATFLQSFLVEYGLSTQEGVALMAMAEAFLRVPDSTTLDELISEKIGGPNWRSHSGQASSFLVNASTWALLLSGRLLSKTQESGMATTLQRLLQTLGEPVLRRVMTEAMERMGEHFVVGEDIASAIARTDADPRYREYSFSFDMLGEAALTERDAQAYFDSYKLALSTLARQAGEDIRHNSGISVKLSALHPRFTLLQKPRSFDALFARLLQLARIAAENKLNLNIDGEAAESMEFTLDIFEALAESQELGDWPGLGIVVQAYSRNAHHIIDWLRALARKRNRRFMVRLVKGAYWDTEIKRAQVLGLDSYPVFTRKHYTDVSYIVAARTLMRSTDYLYPQFATHNAHTLSALLAMAEQHQLRPDGFEFQRLYGMGEDLHETTRRNYASNHRIYAPVGVHEDLLAYLVRRLLENGANSSFVHQLTDASVPAAAVAADPFARLEIAAVEETGIPEPGQLYAGRKNSRGWDLADAASLTELAALREPWSDRVWHARPLLLNRAESLPPREVYNPGRPEDLVGRVEECADRDIADALSVAVDYAPTWRATAATTRVEILGKAAELLEANCGELLAILLRETGKNGADAIDEWREAIDFLRYYGVQARGDIARSRAPLGVFACVAPWNFPLSIFVGQVAAALVTGNCVLAKPAEQATLVAFRATQLLHQAGVPPAALQLLPGDGPRVGATLCGDARLDGVSFTGSLAVARSIQRAQAGNARVDAALIAETGGINAMIVDSTALPEQTVKDILSSAFSSAGQRCSALRIVYLQEDIAERFIEMLTGAMDLLCIDDPWQWQTDIGPVIDEETRAQLQAYIDSQRVLHSVQFTARGCYVAPTLIEVAGIAALEREVFGPVLHIARFNAAGLEDVIEDINAAGYGLTFSIHSRLARRVDRCIERLNIGNIYVNRNQIGAVVESQPFGGCGLSGTGPKAGGPHYLSGYSRPSQDHRRARNALEGKGNALDSHLPAIAASDLQAAVLALDSSRWRRSNTRLGLLLKAFPESPAIAACESLAASHSEQMAGPTGESNSYRLYNDGCALCLGPGPELALEQALQGIAFGGSAVVCAAKTPAIDAALLALEALGAPIRWLAASPQLDAIRPLTGVSRVSRCDSDESARALRVAVAQMQGAIVRFVAEPVDPLAYLGERHVCNDITSGGGNVALMSGRPGAAAASPDRS